MIEFRALGTLDLRRTDGHEFHSLLAQPKRVALLTYLCVASPRGFHRRDTLLGLFWPNVDQTHARTSLRNALHVLRHSLGENAFHSRGDEEVAVDFDMIWCDAVAFDERVALNDVDGGLDLYRGDLLTGFFLDDVPSFERWLESERTRLRASAARATRVASERREAERDFTQAVSLARRAVDLAATDERAVRGLIELLARVGDRAGALHAYETFAQHLTAEFGAEPSAETRVLMERVRSHQIVAANIDSSLIGAPVENDLGSLPSSGTTSGTYVTRPGGPRATRIAMAIGSAILLTVGIVVLAHGMIRPAFAPNRVAVVPFQNLTGRPDLDFLGNLAADQVVADLGRNNLGEVIEGDRMSSVSPDPNSSSSNDKWREHLRGVADRTGAGLILSGSYYVEHDSVHVRAELFDVKRRRITSSIGPVASPVRVPSEAANRLSAQVVGALMPLFGERSAGIVRQRGWSVPRPLEARRETNEGLELFLRGGPVEDYRNALQHFSRAFALDSTNFFPLLEATLAHLSLGEYAQADSLVAVISASRSKLDVGGGLFLDLVAANVRGDRLRAAEISRRSLERSRGVVWEFQAGYQALSAARPREAIKMMNGLDPDSGFLKGVWAYRGVMAEAYHVLGDHESELDLARTQRRIDSQLLSTLLYEVRALAALGRIDEVRTRISESEGLPPQSGLIPSLPPLRGLGPGSVMTEAALELRAHGQADASRQIVNRAIEWYASRLRQAPRQESLQKGLASVQYLAGDWQASMTMWTALSEQNPTDVDCLGYVGVSAARLGRRVDATNVDRRLRDWNRLYTFGRNTLWRARIAAQLGERQRAVDLLRQAFAEGHVFDSELHRDFDLETLRGFKGFEDILNPAA